MYFQSLTSSLVREGLAKAREQNRQNRETAYERMWDFYRGGSEISGFLIRKPAEDASEFAQRVARIEYPNEVRKIARDLRANAYGFDVDRTLLPPATDAHNKTLKDILDKSGIGISQVRYSEAMIVAGDGWALVRWDAAGNRLAVDSVLPQNMWAAWNPDNPAVLSEVVEERIDAFAPLVNNKPVSVFWIWNNREFNLVNADGIGIPHPITNRVGPWPNSYGIIPYIHFPAQPSSGDQYGTSYINDAVTVQQLILNRRSELDTLIETQTFGVLVTSGIEKPSFEVGPRRAVSVGPDGDAKFIQPGADIQAVREAIKQSIEEMFDASGMPMSAEVSTASSGLALAIKMRPLTARVEEIRSVAKHYEKDLLRLICTVASTHGVDLPVGDACVPEIAFPTNVLPSDKDGEFKRDFAMVTAIPPMMTRAEFIRLWHNIKDPAMLQKYIDDLDAEARLNMSQSGRMYTDDSSMTRFGGVPTTQVATTPIQPSDPVGGGKYPKVISDGGGLQL